MRRNLLCLILAFVTAGCALIRPPPACRGPLQQINTPTKEIAHGQA